MKRLLFLIICSLSMFGLAAQTAVDDAKAFQDELNAKYANPEQSPLTKKSLKYFKGLDFYPIDTNYRVEAKFERVKNPEPFEMKTTTERRPVYYVYATAKFKLHGKKYKLRIYQSKGLSETDEFKDYLFLPFTDLSSGAESYGGGRFMDLAIPEGKTIILDFNKAYNPYCAYNDKYSCPIPPKENHLNTYVKAGVKAPEDH